MGFNSGFKGLKRERERERSKKLLPLYSALSVKNAISLLNVFEGNFINGWKVLRQKILFSPTSGKTFSFYFA